jgi:hypothetical protein
VCSKNIKSFGAELDVRLKPTSINVKEVKSEQAPEYSGEVGDLFGVCRDVGIEPSLKGVLYLIHLF